MNDLTMNNISMLSDPSIKAPKKGHEITSRAIKRPSFSYIHLELISDSSSVPDLDDLLVRSYLTSGLSIFLGLTGTAISVDILKVDGAECWIRVPREDLSAVLAATGQWIGGNEKLAWRLRDSGNWLGSLLSTSSAQDFWKI